MTATLAPVIKTDFRPRFTRGGVTKPECWFATTTNKVWEFAREDDTRTNWSVYYRPYVDDGSLPVPVVVLGSLRACQVFAAQPSALELVERRKAEFAADVAKAVA